MREFRPDPKPPSTKKGGKSPQRAGKRVEKIVATQLGEKPTVGSGAFKGGNKNLTGDIDVRDNDGRDWIKLEVKMTGAVNAGGDPVYSLNAKVLKQMEDEAHAAGELAGLVVHYKGGKQYVVMPFDDWKLLIADAKLGKEAAK